MQIELISIEALPELTKNAVAVDLGYYCAWLDHATGAVVVMASGAAQAVVMRPDEVID